MQKLRYLRYNFSLRIIEDCAQSYDARDRNGILTGTLGCISCFSFNPMKVLPALGDGGMILFDDPSLVERSYRLRHSGMTGTSNSCLELSSNSRMDALQSSVLNVRLNFHKEKLMHRRMLVKKYIDDLPPFIRVVVNDVNYSNHYVMQTLVPGNRKELIDYLYLQGIETKIRHNFLISNLPPFANDPKLNLDVSSDLISSSLCLPLHNNMSTNDVEHICRTISNFYK